MLGICRVSACIDAVPGTEICKIDLGQKRVNQKAKWDVDSPR